MTKINRQLYKLTARKVETKKKQGKYADGGGLYLQVSPTGSKSWLFRYKVGPRGNEKQYAVGLGAVMNVGLAEARDKAKQMRLLRLEGKDPMAVKRETAVAALAQKLHSRTFAQCVDAYLDQHSSGWKNDKHRQQWRSTLNRACDSFGSLMVSSIDTTIIAALLTPIWAKTPETGSRLRGRIEKVLDWATAVGLREGENPARWKGHLEHVLKAKGKGGHHEAMPWGDVPTFMAGLRAKDSVSARALEFTILTAARTGETIGATWDEIDLDARVWTVPASRIKGGKEHRVPLSDRAVEILRACSGKFARTDFIFPLSNMAMLQLLRGMPGGNGYTVHGFRSAFRDWVAERTNYPQHVAEMALAHVIGDKVEKAYRRGDLFEKRTRLMTEWCRYCENPQPAGDNVVSMRA